jgi:hypothetical protein
MSCGSRGDTDTLCVHGGGTTLIVWELEAIADCVGLTVRVSVVETLPLALRVPVGGGVMVRVNVRLTEMVSDLDRCAAPSPACAKKRRHSSAVECRCCVAGVTAVGAADVPGTAQHNINRTQHTNIR